MFRVGLRAQFFAAGALLLGITVALGAAGAFAFARLSRIVGATLSDSEATTQATAALAGALEREDDAVLLLANGDARGPAVLADERKEVAADLVRLESLLVTPAERAESRRLHDAVARYQEAGDALARLPDSQARRDDYHRAVNSRLRDAVGLVSGIRNRHLALTEKAAVFARDEARKAAGVATLVSLLALLAGAAVAFYFGRRVLTPLRALSRTVAAVRRGDFTVRVETGSSDELGQLVAEFNRMTERLGELRRANVDEVLRANKTLEATLAALPDAVLIVDPEGHVTAANPPARELVRFQAAQPQPLDGLALPPAAIDAIRDVLARRKLQAGTLELTGAVTMDGAKLLPRVMPVPYAGERQGAVAVLYDVTGLVRLDEMRRELIAVASHELRTPLTTLRMTLLMLQESASAFSARQKELITTAFGGVEQLGATVDEFLDFTRIEAGQLRLNWDLVDVGALVDEVARAMRPQCEDAGLTLETELPEGAPVVRGDPARLRSVLSNLLANAIKYTPARQSIRIEIGERDEPTGEHTVELAVSDTGRGIAPEYRERVFDKFFRVEHESANGDDGVRGTGIGLYLSREIAVAHGGALRCVEAPAGRGARFVLTLPAPQRPGA